MPYYRYLTKKVMSE